MKRSARIVLGITLASIVGLTVFQNCSQPGSINVTDPFKGEREAEASRLALGADDETVTVGLNPVPNLKMFFVVDNSGTMQSNQFNLSGSFGSMFDSSSSESLSKFDATTYLISTAQKSPAFAAERMMLDKIVDQQKNYNDSLVLPLNIFSSQARDNSYNYGYLPGDNIGYKIQVSTSPLKYSFSPAVVLGDMQNANGVSFKPSIRKLASESSSVMESEFKKRLSILNSDRIPLVKDGSNYKPEHASIVDNESGLCAVARILRNPEKFFKAGEMVSFTIVSDENDNDPQGLNCIQAQTELTGAEDLVDGECLQRETSVTYTTAVSTKQPDSCKINGSTGYNIRFAYPKYTYTTDVTYKYVATPAKYNANYSDITYRVVDVPAVYSANYSDITYKIQDAAAIYSANYSDITYRSLKTAANYKAAYTDLSYQYRIYTYQYKQTNIAYYIQQCFDIVSDGIVTGKKCNVVPNVKNDVRDKDYSGNCYAFAQTLNSNAVNSDGYKPTCTVSFKNVGVCDVADANCKASFTLAVNKVMGLAGLYTPAQCLAKAKTNANYEPNTDASCADASKVVAACSASENTTGCVLNAPAIYESKVAYGILGQFSAQADCEAAAAKQSGYVSGGTSSCVLAPKEVASCSAAESSVGCTLKTPATYKNTIAKAIIGKFLAQADCDSAAMKQSGYVAGGTNSCALALKDVSTCSTAETNSGCVIKTAATYKPATAKGVLGQFSAQSDCDAAAAKQAGYVAGGTNSCALALKEVSPCSAVESAAGCALKTEATYDFKTISATGDLTAVENGCFNYAKALAGNAVVSASDVSACKKVSVSTNVNQDIILNFSEIAASVDNGIVLAANADCGVVKSLALAKAQKTIPQIADSDTCKILAVNKAIEYSELLAPSATTCTAQATTRCTAENLRDCASALIVGTTTNSNPIAVLKLKEEITCASKCNTSKLDFCAEDKASDITIAQYLKKKYGDSATCAAVTADIIGTGIAKKAIVMTNVTNACMPTLQNIPTYFAKLVGPYRSKGLDVDYVAGTMKDANGVNVPKMSLIDFIKERSQALSNGQMVFSALVRTSKDPLGLGGTFGADYEKLITETKGQLGSVLSNDYSLILKDLSGVIKSAIERTFVMQKMKSHQVIKKVYQMSKKSSQLLEIDQALWTQNGASVVFSNALEINDSDQFKIEFANY